MNRSLRILTGILLTLATTLWVSCRNSTDSKPAETFSHPAPPNIDIENAEKFIKSAFYNLSKYFPEASGEADFHNKYAAYSRGCEIDFNVALRRKYSSHSSYTIDVRSKLINQPKTDRSNLGLITLTYVAIPNDFSKAKHRYPDSRDYRKITDFQKRLVSFMVSIVKDNRNCLKTPTTSAL